MTRYTGEGTALLKRIELVYEPKAPSEVKVSQAITDPGEIEDILENADRQGCVMGMDKKMRIGRIVYSCSVQDEHMREDSSLRYDEYVSMGRPDRIRVEKVMIYRTKK
ncbi:hypothetical protein ACFL3V_04480 [Nanoarchaeota archaeon]